MNRLLCAVCSPTQGQKVLIVCAQVVLEASSLLGDRCSGLFPRLADGFIYKVVCLKEQVSTCILVICYVMCQKQEEVCSVFRCVLARCGCVAIYFGHVYKLSVPYCR